MVGLSLSPEPWSVPSHRPVQPKAFCVIKNSSGFSQSLRNRPGGGYRHLYMEMGVRDILYNAQMSTGREQSTLFIDLPSPSGLPDEQN